jgi:undecaprenyl-diphosphatase
MTVEIALYIKSVILAIIEGLTEFIPVSSTGHMILLGNFIEFTGEKAASFEIFIQLGAILAVVVLYRDRFWGLIPQLSSSQSFAKSIFYGEKKPTITHIFLGIIPVLIVGFFSYRVIKEVLFNPVTVSFALIFGGLIMIIVEILPITKKTDQVDEITLKQALLIGFGQCLAVWPGMSRSGATIVTGLILGIRHRAIADFSFIIAVPVMLAAVAYDLLKSWHLLEFADLGYFITGFIIAFLVSWASIKWFLKILTKVTLLPFGIYRIILGIFCLWIFL